MLDMFMYKLSFKTIFIFIIVNNLFGLKNKKQTWRKKFFNIKINTFFNKKSEKLLTKNICIVYF